MAETDFIKSADRTIELLEQLIAHKQNLVDKLVEKGETVSMSDSFDSLIQKAGEVIPDGYTEDSEVVALIDDVISLIYSSTNINTNGVVIGNTTYRAFGYDSVGGTTPWAEWVDSSFNTDGYLFNEDGYLVLPGVGYVVGGTSASKQTKTDTINTWYTAYKLQAFGQYMGGAS